MRTSQGELERVGKQKKEHRATSKVKNRPFVLAWACSGICRIQILIMNFSKQKVKRHWCPKKSRVCRPFQAHGTV